MNIEPNAQTHVTGFNRIPADNDKPLLQVAAGVESWYAISMADALTDSARDLLRKSVGAAEPMEADAAYLCAFALDAAQALRAAAGVEA